MRIFPRRVVRRIPSRAQGRIPAATLASTLLLLGVARPAAPQVRAPLPAAPAATRLGELYAAVERDNPKIAAARALVRAAQARVPAASKLPDPQFQLGFMNYSLPGLAPMQSLGMTQLQLMQMVPLGGKLSLAGRVAEAQAAAADERVQEVVWELRSQAAMAFYDLYATDRQLAVSRETLRLLQDIALTTESMYRVGGGRQADVLRAQVEVAKMAEDTLRMTAMRQAMVARLDALLDRDVAAGVATPELPQFPDSLPAQGRLDSLAASTRPLIRAGLEEVRAADAAATLARKEIIPDLQVGVQYGQRGAPMTDATGMTERTTERMGSLMIGASIPLFARARQLQMRTEANAMMAMAEADLAAMRAETRGRIGEAYANLTRARRLQQLYRTTVLPQAEATVASALSAYRVGQVDFMTLLDDRTTVNEYRKELATLEADEGKAWAELEMLTGHQLLDANRTARAAADATTAATTKRGVR
ncbi:MAG TPA: TolC family protein [Gemmatimonadaceae bacterium]|nr:TolC family protein [Gemmatimonadaceae bacterium]